MSAVIDSIKAKHEEAMAMVSSIANRLHRDGEWARCTDLLHNVRHAKAAFAELLKYHKQFKAAVGVAAKIERTA